MKRRGKRRTGEMHSTSVGKTIRHRGVKLATVLAACSTVTAPAQTMQAPNIATTPTLYVVPYAHLDTQWRWEMPQSISEYMLKTMRVNFDYIDKYPHYIFNWTGSNRYRLMKEYFPDDYARMAGYIAQGRWFPAGSSVEEGDVNLPGAEGIFRQILYGNTYYRHEFGKASNEFMLPDCFGFPGSLPAILAHSGVRGFSTQKLNAQWQPAAKVGGAGSPEDTPEGIPFNVGTWTGPDGSKVIAALNPGNYNGGASVDLSKANAPRPAPTHAEEAGLTPQQRNAMRRYYTQQEPNWVSRIELDGKVTGVFADYHYVGTGDIGGATTESTVKLLEAIVTKSTTTLPHPAFVKDPALDKPVQVGLGPVHVLEATADQMFNDIKPDMTGRMPNYQGDLELINHSAGSLTSEAYHKWWVTENEVLADAAEKSSLVSAWLGGPAYPQKRLNDAWTLELGGHFHDTGAGTATPRAYQFAWNDDIIAGNQFAGVFRSATQEVAAAMDTRGPGVPVVLFNSLNVPREDLAEVMLPAGMGQSVHAVAASGAEIPAQVSEGKVIFSAALPPVGYAVYRLVPGAAKQPTKVLNVSQNSLENARYRVSINSDGDIASVFDKSLNKELLAAPMRLAISNDTPKQWPAWNMDFDQEQAPPRAYVSGPAKIRIKEDGPVRVSVEIERSAEGSTYKQVVSLAAGPAGNRLEVHNIIDWRGKASNLKASFPLAATNINATYNEDVGTVQRPTAFDRQFEVLSHRWIDLTDASGAFGATVLTEAKNGSDKPNDNTVRLTLLRSPGISPGGANYSDQANQDWGRHEFTYGLTGHNGDWRSAQTDWQGDRLSEPVRAFVTTPHPGVLGKQFSFVHVDNPRVRVLAVKKAEDSDEIVVRLVELNGKPASNVHLGFATNVVQAREINAQELPMTGTPTMEGGQLVTSFAGYEPKTFAVRLAPFANKLPADVSSPVALQYDIATATNNDANTPNGGFDGSGNAYPAEMMPRDLVYGPASFHLAAAATGSPNAVTAKGQTIALPAGDFNRVYVLAAANGDQQTTFRIGDSAQQATVENWGGFIGQWDTRLWNLPPARDWAISAHPGAWPPRDFVEREEPPKSPKFPEDYIGLQEGYIKPANVGWYSSHHHTATGLNVPYQYSYLFVYGFDVPRGAKTLTLPDNGNVRVFAVSAVMEGPEVTDGEPLVPPLRHTSAPTETVQ